MYIAHTHLIIFRYDILLITFLKKRKQSQGQGPGQARLVPWKSSNDDFTVKVPVRATIASSITLVIALIVTYGCVISIMENDTSAWKILMFTGCMVTSTQVPILIGEFLELN